MTDVNFRAIPAARHPEDELASEPWYSISPQDVFPEEFRHFLCSDKRIKPLFEMLHGDLFDVEYWQRVQQRILAGEIDDVYAYRRQQRFSQRRDEKRWAETPAINTL